jgi:peptidoglycan/LPS O-acetylase OafA/YrhL
VFVAGVWLYARRGPRLRLWVFVAFLLAVYAGNVTGPTPPSARAVAIVGLAAWILPVWAAWVDRWKETKA